MSRTIQEVKSNLELEKQIKQALIDQANATTGNTDTDLTSAVDSLVSGYGQDDGSGKDTLNALLTNTLETYSNESITTIKAYAFYNCTSLTNVNIPNVTSIGNDAFYKTGVTTINMPKLTIIGEKAFASSSVCSVDFTNVTSVGNNAFRYSKLKEAILPSMTKVGNGAFNQCFDLVNVDIPNVTEIDSAGFCECPALKTINMPKVTKLTGAYCFMYDRSLEAIILPADTVCVLGATNIFSQSSIANGTAYIYVPDNLVEDYKVATNWSTYADQIKPLSEYVEVTE